LAVPGLFLTVYTELITYSSAALLVFIFGGPKLGLFAAGVAVVIGAARIPSAMRRRAQFRLARALIDKRCPACDYNLSGLTALTVSGSTLQHVGPALCPECGAPWPLVPPPVPNEILSSPIAM